MRGLRFAVLLTGDPLERWHVRCLDHLDDVAELAAVIVSREKPIAGGSEGDPIGMRWLAGRARTTVAGVPERFSHVVTRTAGSTDAFQRREWDFMLKLGRGSIPDGLEIATRLGVWYFEHEHRATSMPFFREVYDGDDVTRAELLALHPEGGELELLEQGYFRTERRSYTASRNRVLEAAATWPARSCRRILAETQEPSALRKYHAVPPPTGGPPSAVSLPRYYARMTERRLLLAWQRLFRHPQWNIGILDASASSLVTSAYADERIEWLPLHDRKGFLADPFGVVRDGTLHVLCERFSYRDSKGYICALDLTPTGPPAAPEPAIELPVHLSYPFLVEQRDQGMDEIYCIPESADANEIALFRADTFPRTWSKVAVLIPDFPGIDPTVFRHDGSWWLMCTRKGSLEDVELWAWHAQSLLGPWTPHALNPIKSDVRGSRPGGRPFHHEAALYRPAQDCSRTYGWRVAIQRVTRLTPTEFAEEQASVLEASPRSAFPHGRHTLTPIGDKVLVDGRRDVFVWAAFRAFLKIWAADWSRRARRSRSPDVSH
jgi:hypothetical protein